MTVLIIKVSGVALLEKSLIEQKPQYKEYIEKTSAFLPWFPKKVPRRTTKAIDKIQIFLCDLYINPLRPLLLNEYLYLIFIFCSSLA